jgi:hypothetical protein
LSVNEVMLTTDSIPSFIEVKAMERGLQKARQQAILDALDTRFGALSEQARPLVEGITEEHRLRSAHRLAITTPSVQHFLENA